MWPHVSPGEPVCFCSIADYRSKIMTMFPQLVYAGVASWCIFAFWPAQMFTVIFLRRCTLVHLRLLTCTNVHSLQPKECPGKPRTACLFLFNANRARTIHSVDILAQANHFAKELAAPPNKQMRTVGSGYAARIERQRQVDVFWKKFHQSLNGVRSEQNVAQDFLLSVGIKSNRNISLIAWR